MPLSPPAPPLIISCITPLIEEPFFSSPDCPARAIPDRINKANSPTNAIFFISLSP
jgi:hypothetical protein